jgi:DNA uptake protein ComE-like DNA-binding protein
MGVSMDAPDDQSVVSLVHGPHVSTSVLLLGGVSLLCITGSVIALTIFLRVKEPIEFHMAVDSTGSVAGTSISSVYVDVAGAVQYPGVYAIAEGSRIDDVLKKAGGLSNRADEEMVGKIINRASCVKDGMKVYIPFRIPETIIGNTTLGSKSPVISQNASQSIISINTASLTDLDRLPGVGPVIGQKIIDNRPYGSIEELVTKKAVSASLFDKIRQSLSL